MNSLSEITCLDVCEGVSKRVLKDLSKLSYPKILEEYINETDHGSARGYENIIKLGKLVERLQKDYNNVPTS